MLLAITGASGLVGANLAVLLRQAGHRVRCTRRPDSKTDHLDGFDVEWVDGDIENQEALVRAFDGASAIFHCAARVSVKRLVTPSLVRANVEGTRNVLEAAKSCGGPRVIHCSTVAARAVSLDGTPVTEEQPYNFHDFGLDDGYSVTKRDAEALVVAAARAGQDAVIVNPTFMFGPYDVRPSSGQMIVDLIRGKIPVSTLGVNNFSDVRDICRGMIAAWEKGRSGEAYILGGHNLTYREIFRRISEIAGTRPPRICLPQFAVGLLAWILTVKERITGHESFVNSATVRYSGCSNFCFSSAKAERELGYRVSPIEPAIGDAIAWFKVRGML